MSFPAYEKYKDSGVEWLGEVPEHWKVLQAKRIFLRRKDLNTGMRCDNRLALTMRGVIPRSMDDLDGLQASEFETYQIFNAGDLAFKLIDLQNIKTSRVGLVPETGIMSPAYIRLAARDAAASPKAAYWYFTDLYNRQVFNQLGGGVRQTLGPEELLTLPTPKVPADEQQAIATFLDRETAKIDDLVAEQERLIALLAEKRQAIISHAVTKGLNPNAPMKDSGIEWLGEVPEHWEVVPVKRLTTHITSGPRGWSDLTGDEGAAFFQSQHIGCLMDVALDDPKRLVPPTDTDAERARLQIDDVVICITGGRTGAVAHVPEHIEEAYINQHVCLLRPEREIVGRFLAYGLFSTGSQEQLACASYGLKQGLGLDQVRSTFLANPPSKEEQMGIVLFLDKQTARLDALTKEAERGIELLKERRAALISAAVTGKIDVRGLANVGTGQELI